jgi:diguanylate cyclase (GGDEF)-like protein
MYAKDGRVVWVRDEAVLIRDERGMPRYSIGTIMEIGDRKQAEEQATFGAYHDDLTGLPSRAMFEELLQLSIERAGHHSASVAVLLVDLDDFRLVNDSLGHASGDELLKMVADRLRDSARETDLVARRGGDQFLLLLADLPGHDPSELETAMIRVEAVAQRIQEALSSPFILSGTEVYLAASIGISVYPYDGDEGGTLLRNAEAAMYDDKKGGSPGYVISRRGALDSAAKLRFVTRLRKAVEAQRWTLHYQPVIELDHGRMVGVEALIRWVESDGTLVPPSEFIPLAEELGLIEDIGDWVVRELVYQVTAWQELGIDLEVSFNVSPRQFWQAEFADKLIAQVAAARIDPSRVLVEVTETSAMLDPDRAEEILGRLHEGGLAIAIDDFGTGYSSLSRLRSMPVRVLKIDRSFVSGVDADPQNASIVAAFLELSKGLGMTTLAEGIETEGELAFLRERGCRLGQGFLFSRPVPPEEIIAFAFGGGPGAVGEPVDAPARSAVR